VLYERLARRPSSRPLARATPDAAPGDRAVREKPVRNVIFDFGGVLVRWTPEEVIRSFYAEEPLRSRVREAVFQHADWIEMDRGALSDADAVRRFAARMGRPAGEMRSLLQYVKDSLTPMADSFAIVADLARRGIPVYGLSNMSASTFAHLKERYDVWSQFRGIVISGEVNLVKPDARIFELICRRYGLVPAQSIFIDDHPPNVEAARRHGFAAIQFSDARQCLDELEDYLA
jgi:putative hydrolase of the HAD superfamily